MKVKVKYFAGLRERFGRDEEVLELAEGTDVGGLWQRLITGHTLPDGIMSTVNMEYVQDDVILHEGDEVAFFPPVTGG